MKRRTITFQLILFVVLAFLQSRFFYSQLPFHRYLPDLAFILIIFASIQTGRKNSHWIGFLGGFLLHAFMQPDSVLGVYAFILTIICFIAGQMKGRLIIDPILLPLLYVFAALIMKGMFLFIFSLLPDLEICRISFIDFVISTAITTLCAPIIYNIMRLFRLIDLNERIRK